MLIVLGGVLLIAAGLIASGLEQSKYLVPYAGRFGYPINGAGVVIIGAFISASQIFYSSLILTLVFFAAVLLIWILMVVVIKRKAAERTALLSGKTGEATTDFMLNNNGIAYGKINIDGKQYRSYVAREAKYDTDTLPQFVPGQTPAVSEAQRNLDTMAQMKADPCLVHKGTKLLVMELESMTPRVAMIKNNVI